MTTTDFSDEPHIKRIAEALWAREPVGSAALLVGAGFSRNAAPIHASARGMPGWNDIYATMVDQLYPAPRGEPDVASNRAPNPAAKPAKLTYRDWLLKQTGATSAYLRIAEEFEAHFGRDALDKLIVRHVPDRKFLPGKLHHMLVQLPWADIMTTNWDTLLERAAEAAEERVYDVLRTVEEIPDARSPRVIKLHGSFPAHRPFVFTEEDFRTYPARFGAFVNLAQQLAMENTLVLLGFSGDDPNFLYWSGWVRDRLGPKAPLIYLVGVLELSAPKRKMLESRRIQPIDLAQLPQFANWPETLQMEYAHQWFLERLRAAEPYPSQRWPRPAAGFVPPLVHVTPPIDPRAPIAEPDFSGQTPAVETLRRLVVQWRQNRSVYPDWVVPPFETSRLLWSRIDRHLDDVVEGLRALEEDERLEALFELNWQLEAALIPLILTVDDFIIALLDGMVVRYDELSADQARQFRALALAIVRHAREENDPVLFARWADWLGPRLGGDAEARDRLTYERCLWNRANLEIDALEERVKNWEAQSDSYWLLRKAGLLADLGRDVEASELSSQALSAIRRQTLRGAQDIASWSRESFAMLFRSSVLHGELDQWRQNKPIRDRFELRQEQLQARGCPGKRDFFELIERLAQVPPPLKQPLESIRRFDLGSTYVTHHFGRIDPRIQRLLAYQALRFLEETGLPVRIGHVAVAGQMLPEAARWLIDVAPTRAIDAFLRASPGASDKQFDKLLTRTTIARIETGEADRLIDRVVRLIGAARARIDASSLKAGFWTERLKSTLEIASRIVLRAPARAPELLELALALHTNLRFSRRIALGDELQRLVKRLFEAADATDHDAMLLAIFRHPIPANVGDYADNTADLAAGLSPDLRVETRDGAWDEVVAKTIAALGDPTARKAATWRVNWMLNANLLNIEERQRCAEALWAPEHCEAGLPGNTVFYPSAFLTLPRPDGIDAKAAVSRLLLIGTPLTDAIVADGALASAVESKIFELSEAQLIAEIERLDAFVANHAPAPDHPDIFGDERRSLVVCCARIAAGLARRVLTHSAALDRLRSFAALDRYPLRLEPAIAALVRLGILDAEEALLRLGALLAGTDATDSLLLGGFFDNVLWVEDPDPVFEAAMWSKLAQTLAARRPEPLARIVRFIAHVMTANPARVPRSIDDMLGLGLALILAETEMAAPAEQLGYDPFLVRFFGALLITAMDREDRGDAAMRAAWLQAIDRDPLPDTRRARALAIRPPKSGSATEVLGDDEG